MAVKLLHLRHFLFVFTLALTSCSSFDTPENQNDTISSPSDQNTHSTQSTIQPAPPARQIALLLPQHEGSGLVNAGVAIQAGFMADYKNTTPLPTIKVYDQDHASLAIQEGANYIVGPLDKNKVSQLHDNESISTDNIIIIALNNPDNSKVVSNMIKFSLSPVQEAQQIADKAFQDGHHKALMITPKGEWGQNIANALQQRWESQGGEISNSITVDSLNTLSPQIQQLLQNHSQADVVFMIVQPAFARQIKPLLNYYHADNLPVYSTSLVYSGLPDSNKDNALNGVIFCDMPIVLDQSSPWAATRGNMMSTQPANIQKYIRLYALGWDAAYLTKHFDEIYQGIYGATGKLTLSNQNEIMRTLKFAVFKNGQPQLLP
jgi:outer membrane PBP1 activator LpoA protein